MEGLIWIVVILAAIALAFAWPGLRLKRALARPLDPAQRAILERNLPIYPNMSGELQLQLQKLVQQFLFQ